MRKPEQAAEVVHPFRPVFDSRSRVLILGTMPSPASRRNAFYYGHPQNRFWPALAAVFGEPVPGSAEERRAFALRHGVALWDVLASCRIAGAGDSSIRGPQANDFSGLFAAAPVRAVFTTGKTAYRLFVRLVPVPEGLPVFCLPSPSPANCAVHLEELVAEYRAILPYLGRGNAAAAGAQGHP